MTTGRKGCEILRPVPGSQPDYHYRFGKLLSNNRAVSCRYRRGMHCVNSAYNVSKKSAGMTEETTRTCQCNPLPCWLHMHWIPAFTGITGRYLQRWALPPIGWEDYCCGRMNSTLQFCYAVKRRWSNEFDPAVTLTGGRSKQDIRIQHYKSRNVCTRSVR